ncbi:MAG: hypothetical protein LC642_06400, partial [Verrucomicrobiaceae bacterium]|nr:hypothetical protein [Verrucomicrobiaceae bacterium]
MLTRSPRRGLSRARRNAHAARKREAPLRAELFGVEQLARHAEAIARRHRLSEGRGSTRLLAQLGRNEEILRAFNRATLAVDKERRVTPAAEWLLDNFYLIEEQIQLARRHLPRGYSRELPRLANDGADGWLRVYELVLELIAHVDAQIDAESLTAFIAAYQKVAALKLGELWAVPIMLRLGLIENLARIATALARERADRNLARTWVDRLEETAEKNPSQLVIVVAEMAQSELPLSSSFVAEFCQRLRLNPVLHIARGWLEQRLSEQGLSVEQLVREESQSQASDQVSVSHSISSLRSLSAINWREFVETLSLVEQQLRGEPADVYADMDFATRDHYRHIVEMLARGSGLAEVEIARRAVTLAEENARQKGREDRSAHVGFFLIDKGRRQLERTATVRWSWRKLLEHSIRRFPFAFYVGGIVLLTAAATFAFARAAQVFAVPGWVINFCTVTFMLGMS